MSKEWWWAKVGLALSYLAFFFSPIAPLLICVGLLVFADLYTGIKAAKKRGEDINSHGYKRSVNKSVLYFLAIILSRLMEVIFFPELPIATITAGYIALTEFKSNIENISYVTGIDIWRAILNKLQGAKSNKHDLDPDGDKDEKTT